MKKLISIFIFFILTSVFYLLSSSSVHAEANPGKVCPPGESRYRPGGSCEKTTPSIPTNISDYPLTCQDIPIANLNNDGLYPPLLTYRRILTSDISQAELGGFGPNATAIGSYSPDALAQIYAFNGLFDKPASMENETRESARTYWRLLSTYEQANAKAVYFSLVKNSQFVNNTSIEFFNRSKTTTSATTSNDSISVTNLAIRLPDCLSKFPICKDYIKTYFDLHENDRAAYDALLPFNFDNVRGYQVLNNIIYKENLPYVKAISDGLNSSRAGLLNLLSPQWINNLRFQNLNLDPNNPSGLPGDISGSIIASYASPYSPNNCLDHDNSTYLPSPLTFPTELNNGPEVLKQNVDIKITSITREQVTDPLTGLTSLKYVWSGSAEGLPVIVVNNPKLEDLSQSISGPQSLTAMFLPNATEVPNRDLVAPVAALESDNTDTKVDGKTNEPGKARIARTGGESQTKLCELRNQWLIPAGLQKNNLDCTDPAKTLTTSVQGPGLSTATIPTEANCNKNSPPGNPGSLLSADSLIKIGFPSGADKNNLKNCYNDLVNRSNAVGVDPAFAMAIWLEESAASWYSTYPDSADFGCTTGGWKRMDFTDQITCFMNLSAAYSRRPVDCFTNGSSLTYQDFLYIYAEGNGGACKNSTSVCTLTDGSTVSHYHNFCNNKQFPARIKNYYSLVTGGKTLNLNAPVR